MSQGRYKWRHDKVLKQIASYIDEKLVENANKAEARKGMIQFVREGERRKEHLVGDCISYGYLSSAKDWMMMVETQIPAEICVTSLRPDIMVISRSSRQIGIVELTVPNEDRIEVSGENGPSTRG